MRPGKLRIETDSAFVVRQLQGNVSSSCDALRPALAEANAAIDRYSNYFGKTLSIVQITRELNSRAHKLAASATGGGPTGSSSATQTT